MRGRGRRVGELERELAMSRQHLARLFHVGVGVAPKVFARVMRLQRTLRSFPTTAGSLAEIALANGYFDQAHLCREFRTLAGLSPRQYSTSAPPGPRPLQEFLRV